MMYQTAVTDTPYTRRNFLVRDHLKELLAYTESARTNSITSLYGRSEFALVFDGQRDSLTELLGVRMSSAANEATIGPPADREATTDSPAIIELTSTAVERRAITRTLDALVERARDENFEDGMDSNLSIGIRVLFRNYGESFAGVLDERLKQSDISARILTEILHTLGNIEDDATRDWRFARLVDFLRSPLTLARDAAAVGLSYLDDKGAVPYLHEAIRRETNEAFREDLRAIVDQFGV